MFDCAINDIIAHAVEAYPKEACGLIVDGRYRPLVNIAEDPTEHFRIKAKDWLRASETGEIQSVVHSHPDGPDCPSAADMNRQIATDVPWGIVSCNDVGALPPFGGGGGDPVEPLVGRGFRHGVTDCYSLIRDYYRLERDVVLPEFPRDWEWWCNEQDLYRDGFGKAGFERLVDVDLRPGDVFLAQIRSGVPNHGGVYLGDGLALHHLAARLPVDATRLSRREPIDRWMKFISHWLRYTG